MASTRVLVTGGCGFIGARLCSALLATGHEVMIIDHRDHFPLTPSLDGRVRLVTTDIRDVAVLTRCLMDYRPDTIFHLAAIHYIPICTAQPLACIGVNVDGTQAILDACVQTPSVRAVILASSAAVYAPDAAPHTEESVLGPTDIYGHTKLWTEQLGQLFHARAGIGVGIARLFNVFGPGETNPHLIPTIIAQMHRGTALRLGNLDTARDYVYVDDVVDGLKRLASACQAGGILACNFGSERAVSGRSLVRLIEAISGETFVVMKDAARMRASDRPVLVSDCARARMLLGWRPETSLEAGLAEMLRHPRTDTMLADERRAAMSRRWEPTGCV